MRILILLAFTCLFYCAQGQVTVPATPAPTEKLNEHSTYQLYLKDPVKKIKKIEYMDGTPVNFELQKDGETVILLNYRKRGAVNITAEDFNGEEVEIRRSPCFIDPVIQT